MANVITYQLPNTPGQSVALCAHCAVTYPGIGPVQHGLHDGRCKGCDAADRMPAAYLANYDTDRLPDDICRVLNATSAMVDANGRVWVEMPGGVSGWLSASRIEHLVEMLEQGV